MHSATGCPALCPQGILFCVAAWQPGVVPSGAGQESNPLKAGQAGEAGACVGWACAWERAVRHGRPGRGSFLVWLLGLGMGDRTGVDLVQGVQAGLRASRGPALQRVDSSVRSVACVRVACVRVVCVLARACGPLLQTKLRLRYCSRTVWPSRCAAAGRCGRAGVAPLDLFACCAPHPLSRLDQVELGGESVDGESSVCVRERVLVPLTTEARPAVS